MSRITQNFALCLSLAAALHLALFGLIFWFFVTHPQKTETLAALTPAPELVELQSAHWIDANLVSAPSLASNADDPESDIPLPAPAEAPKPETEPKPVTERLTPIPKPKPRPKLTRIEPKPSPKPAPRPKLTQIPAPPRKLQPAPLPTSAQKPTPKPTPAPKPAKPAKSAQTSKKPPNSGATGTTGGTAQSGSRPSGNLNDYHASVHRAFSSSWDQPRSITSAGQKFRVKTEIVIARSGQILSARIVENSGHAQMDETVETALSRVKKVGPLPDVIQGASYRVLLNFEL